MGDMSELYDYDMDEEDEDREGSRRDLEEAHQLEQMEALGSSPLGGLTCGDCGALMVLRTGKYGKFWGCTRFPECRGIHAAHQATGAPCGIPADAPTRAARKALHLSMDRLWARGMSRTRHEVYQWLAAVMKLPEERAHIGQFDLAQCQRAITLVEEEYERVIAELFHAEKHRRLRRLRR